MTIPKICIKCDNFQIPTSSQQDATFGNSVGLLRCRYGADYETQASISGTCKHLNSKTDRAKSTLKRIVISAAELHHDTQPAVDIQQQILELLMSIDDNLRVLVGRRR